MFNELDKNLDDLNTMLETENQELNDLFPGGGLDGGSHI